MTYALAKLNVTFFKTLLRCPKSINMHYMQFFQKSETTSENVSFFSLNLIFFITIYIFYYRLFE